MQTAASQVDQARVQFERVFGTDRYQPLGWFKIGLKRCEAVGRVEAFTGKRIGTGFLVRAKDFFDNREPKELLLLTNAHVVNHPDQPFPGAIPPQVGKVVFEAINREFDLGEVVWSSSPADLDATFVTIPALRGDFELCPLVPEPDPFDEAKKPRVYVIGYPGGGGLSISLQDSIWLGRDEKYLHYRTPTEPGSSGSPVFDQEYWTVIGLHHAGKKLHGVTSPEVEANEGILVSAIQKETKAWSKTSGQAE